MKDYTTQYITVERNEKRFTLVASKSHIVTTQRGRVVTKYVEDFAMKWGNTNSNSFGLTELLTKKGNRLTFKQAMKKFLRIAKTTEKVRFK